MPKATKRSSRTSFSSIIIAVGVVGVVCALMILIWPAIQSSARAADRRARHADLSQARVRWEAQGFSNYRLSIQLQPSDDPVCEVVFEVRVASPPTAVLDTCAMRNDSNLQYFIDTHGSVPDLFNYIEGEIDQWGGCGPNGCGCDGRRIVEVLYDREHGYPQRFAERYQHDWTTQRFLQRFLQGCSLIGFSDRAPFTASVSPLE